MVSPIITSLLTALATAGILLLSTKQNADGSTTIFSGDKPIITLTPDQLVQEIPLNSIKCTLRRITTTATSKPANPQVRLVNLAHNNRLLHVSAIPDATMKTNGAVEIEVNGSAILSINTADLTDTDAVTIPIPNEGLLINNNSNIDFFVWASSGTVALTVLVLTGIK